MCARKKTVNVSGAHGKVFGQNKDVSLNLDESEIRRYLRLMKKHNDVDMFRLVLSRLHDEVDKILLFGDRFLNPGIKEIELLASGFHLVSFGFRLSRDAIDSFTVSKDDNTKTKMVILMEKLRHASEFLFQNMSLGRVDFNSKKTITMLYQCWAKINEWSLGKIISVSYSYQLRVKRTLIHCQCLLGNTNMESMYNSLLGGHHYVTGRHASEA